MKLCNALLVAALVGSSASAQNCFTLPGNGSMKSEVGSAHFFDVEVKVPIAVTSFEVRLYNYVPGAKLNVYTTPTTWVGKEGSSMGWTKVVSDAPIPSPSSGARFARVTLSSAVPLAVGKYGFAFEYVACQPAFTDGLFPLYRVSRSGNELTLYEGSVRTAPFRAGGRRSGPRVWDGSFCYVVGRNTAVATRYGSGCPSSFRLSLDSQRPVIGTQMEVTASRVSFRSTANALIVSGARLPGTQPLPGMGTCFLYTVPTVTLPLVRRRDSTATVTFSIPQVAPGSQLYGQVISLRPDVNAVGIATSNGLGWLFYAQ